MPDQHPFHFLSRAFTYPEHPAVDPPWLALLSLARDMGLSDIPPDHAEIASLKELQADYVRLFINAPGGVPAPPYASIYIQNKGLLCQQGHQQAVEFYQRAGLEPIKSSECEDHLAHELAFAGHLLDKDRDPLLREFLTEHLLIWYPIFLERLLAAHPCRFYMILAQVTDLCLKHIPTKEAAHE
jgi:TorA maturation chaperone TorD